MPFDRFWRDARTLIGLLLKSVALHAPGPERTRLRMMLPQTVTRSPGIPDRGARSDPPSVRQHVVIGTGFLVASLVFTLSCSSISDKAQAQKTFSTAEAAVEAMIEAARADDDADLLVILGSESEALISSGDPVYDRMQREVVLAAFEQGWRLGDKGPETKELIIGDEDWPFPVPLVKDQDGWRFDLEEGAEEILARRIGRNELSVIQICMTYLGAQRKYASQGHDGKPAGLYAQKMASDPGQQNGLYWAVNPDEKPSPLGTLAAQAAVEGYADEKTSAQRIPFHGYLFHILTAQGKDAPGGAKDYIVDGEMTGGFALMSYPAEYGSSGIMTFIINQDGILYEKDLGDETSEIASQIKEYNPDTTWHEVE
jgi:hypothetical protein